MELPFASRVTYITILRLPPLKWLALETPVIIMILKEKKKKEILNTDVLLLYCLQILEQVIVKLFLKIGQLPAF